MRQGLLALAALIAVLAPSAAQAGTINVPGEPPNASCYETNCGTYSLGAQAPPGAIHIDPKEGNDRKKFEAAYYDFAPPGWPHQNVQGWQLQIDAAGSATGQNWRIIMCIPGTGSQGLCNSGIVQWRGEPTTVFGLADPTQSVRVALQYIGETASNPATSLIHFDAQVRWVEIDTQQPGIGATLAGRPLAEGMLVGGPDADLVMQATDNTEVGGGAVVLDGRETAFGADGPQDVRVPDGRHRIDLRACDIAAPANCAATGANVAVDTTPPRVAMTSPLVFGQPSPRLEVQAQDPEVNGFRSGVASAQLRLRDANVGAKTEPSGDRIALTPNDPLPEGRYDLDVRVADRAGNAGALAEQTPNPGAEPPQLVIDLNNPFAAPVAPVPNTIVKREPLTISAKLTDSVGVTSARMLVDGEQVQAEFAEPDVTWFWEDPCPGQHTVEAIGADAIGREARSAWTFTVRGTLRGECARRACATSTRVWKRALREARFDLKAQRRNARLARRARTRADRTRYRAAAQRWSRERRTDLRRYRDARHRAKRACRLARRTDEQ